MYKVGIYLRVRKACFVEGMSVREAARVFGLHRDTVRKMLEYSVPPGYRRQRPARRPKLDPYKGVMDQILEQDLTSPKKQRHTAKRIYERLRDEHGFPGKYTIVKDYVRERRRHTREMFLPLSHPPGHAQCDYGEARVIIGGVERKAHYFALDLPHSDGCYVKAYPAETTESFCDGHVSAFAFLGGVPQSILYDNTTLAVARILGDGRRQRTRVFSELQSHYLFEDRFGRPGKGNDKGKVEGLVSYGKLEMDDYVVSDSGVRVWKTPEAHPLLRHTDTTHPSLRDKLAETCSRGRVSGLPRILSENSEDARTWHYFGSLLQEDVIGAALGVARGVGLRGHREH